jgi:hypothetical protein
MERQDSTLFISAKDGCDEIEKFAVRRVEVRCEDDVLLGRAIDIMVT